MEEKTGHDGDCTIYASLCNGRPTDGICTCGYGHQRRRHEDWSHLYSEEREKQVRKVVREARAARRDAQLLLAGSTITVPFKSRIPKRTRGQK